MFRATHALIAAGLLLAIATAATAKPDPQRACRAARLKAIQAQYDGSLRCYDSKWRALARDTDPIDADELLGSCLTRVQERYERSIDRADARPGGGVCRSLSASWLGTGRSYARRVDDTELLVGTPAADLMRHTIRAARRYARALWAAETAHMRRPLAQLRDARFARALDVLGRDLDRVEALAAKRGTAYDRPAIEDRLRLVETFAVRTRDDIRLRTLSAAVQDALVGYWPFDTDAENHSPNGDPTLDTTLVGDAHLAAGFVGQALTLDGRGDYARLANPAGLAALVAGNEPFAISFWMRATGPGSGGASGGILVSKEGEYEIARFGDDRLQVATASPDRYWEWQSTGRVREGSWRHIYVAFERNGLTVLNRGPDGGGSGSGWARNLFPMGDAHPDQEEFRIGGRQNEPQEFQGQIDDVAFWNRPLTSAELTHLLNREWVSLDALDPPDAD